MAVILRIKLVLFSLVALQAVAALAVSSESDRQFIFSEQVSALYSEDLETRWARHFAGSPIEVVTKQNLLSLLRFDREACGKEARDLWAAVDRYGQRASRSDQAGTDEAYRRIRGILDTKGLCQQDLAKVYIFASTAISGPEELGLHYSQLTDLGRDISPLRFFPMLTASLLNSEKVIPLTTEGRKSLGGYWTERRANGEYLFMGGVNCVDSTYFADIEDRPLNLATALFHEINHLDRDKWSLRRELKSPGDGWKPNPEFLLPTGGVNWTKLNLADEALSIAQSVTYQRRLKWMSEFLDWHRHKRGILGLLESALTPKSFTLADDGNLYSEGGPIDTLWRLLTQGSSKYSPADPGDYQFRQAILDLSPIDQVRSVRNQFLLSISKAYFPDLLFDEEKVLTLGKLDFPYGQSDFETWMGWSTSHSIGTYRYKPGRVVSRLEERPATDRRKPYFDLFRVLSSLDLNFALSTRISPLCRMYVEDVATGKVDAYIGTHLIGATHGGEKGVKGGEKGVKGAIRPCINLKGEL